MPDDARVLQVLGLVLPGALAAAIALAVGQPTADWPLARAGGRYLLTGHLTVYADMPYVQMGPLSLVLAAALPGVIYLAVVCALFPLVLWMATLPFPPTRRTYLTTLVGGILLVWPWAAFAVQGHGDDALVVVGVVAMASTLKSHRDIWVVAGFLIAIAAKPTAILFLPLAFVHSRRAGIVAMLAGGLMWAPFVLADVPGFLGAGHGQGFIWANSLPDLLGGIPQTVIPGWLRMIQVIGGLAMCWFLARRRGAAAAVAGVFAFRVLMEPGTWNYYSTSVIAGALLFDLCRGRRVPWATILGFVSFVAALGEPPISLALGAVRLLSLAGVLALTVVARERVTAHFEVNWRSSCPGASLSARELGIQEWALGRWVRGLRARADLGEGGAVHCDPDEDSGSPKISAGLSSDGGVVSGKTVAGVIRKLGLGGVLPKR